MPLVVASGAGAASRQAIGTAVVGGMVAATIMSLLFTPVFYVVMQKLGRVSQEEAGNRAGSKERSCKAGACKMMFGCGRVQCGMVKIC